MAATWKVTKNPTYNTKTKQGKIAKAAGISVEYTKRLSDEASIRIGKGLWSWYCFLDLRIGYGHCTIDLGLCHSAWNNLAKRHCTKLAKEYCADVAKIKELL